MAKGRIQIRKLDLMGYTPETQVYFVQNAGGAGSVATFRFLETHHRYFDATQHMGTLNYALKAPRIAGFKAYAERQGFDVVEGPAI